MACKSVVQHAFRQITHDAIIGCVRRREKVQPRSGHRGKAAATTSAAADIGPKMDLRRTMVLYRSLAMEHFS